MEHLYVSNSGNVTNWITSEIVARSINILIRSQHKRAALVAVYRYIYVYMLLLSNAINAASARGD